MGDVCRHCYRLEKLAGNASSPPVVAWVSKINHVEIVGDQTDEDIAQADVGQYNNGKTLKTKHSFENKNSDDVDVSHSNANYRGHYDVREMGNV